MANPIANKLKKAYGNIVPFKHLPLPFKLAVIWYMAVNGGAWDTPDEMGVAEFNGNMRTKKGEDAYKDFLTKNMDFFNKKYGNKKFGMAFVPREVFEQSLLANFQKNMDSTRHTTIQSWLDEYSSSGPVVKHKQCNWPCILSSFEDELLQDGWHRTHFYLHKKIATIPCLYYTR